MTGDWLPAGPDLPSVLSQYPRLLYTPLAKAEIPAIMFRGSLDARLCAGLIDRFMERGLMPTAEQAATGDSKRLRVDIGASLGTKGNQGEAFFASADQTRELFKTLFVGLPSPVDLVYETLAALVGGKNVRVAREPDGSEYGPAIIRIHYDGHRYKPHVDHVSLREQRFDYAVTRIEHQFAGVLCLQNALAQAGRVPQAILHRHLWMEEMDRLPAEEEFRKLAADRQIENHQVDLGVRDLYFLNTRCIHEVPAVVGDQARVVLAVFIGYSDDDDEVFVWS